MDDIKRVLLIPAFRKVQLERAQPEVITAERVARPSLGDVRASMPQGRRNQGAGLPQQRAFDIMHQVQFSSVAQSCLTL